MFQLSGAVVCAMKTLLTSLYLNDKYAELMAEAASSPAAN
jgi:hypothetical protein